MAVQLIQSIAYAPINKIIQYYPFPRGRCEVKVMEWSNLPMHPASGGVDTSSRIDEPGASFATSLSARLQENIDLPNVMILLITLCSGKKLVLGSPDIPVRANKNISLSSNVFSVNYTFDREPLELIS